MSIGDTDFGVQISVGLLGKFVGAGIAFAGSIVLARAIGDVGYGSYYFLMAIAAVLDNPVTGWATACRKRLSEADFDEDAAAGATLLASMLATAVLLLGGLLANDALSTHLGIENGGVLLGVLFGGTVMFSTTMDIVQGTGRFGATSWFHVGRDIARVVLQITLVWLLSDVLGMVVGIVIANLLIVPVAYRLTGLSVSMPSRTQLASIWGYATSSIPNGFVGTALNRVDVLLLGMLASTGLVGNYEVAMKLTMPAMFATGVASGGLMGRVSNLKSRNKAVATDVTNALSFVSIFAIPLFIGTLLMGREIVVTAYSQQFTKAGTFIAGLALFRLIRSQDEMLASTINGLDRPDLNLRIQLGVFALNLSLGVFLLTVVGPFGVVIATVVSAAVGYLPRALVVKRALPAVSLVPRPLLDQFGSGLVMAVGILVLRQMLPVAGWLKIVVLVALAGATYFLALTVLSRMFRDTVWEILGDAGVGIGS